MKSLSNMFSINNLFESQPLVNNLIGVALFWLVKYLFNTIKRIRSLPHWGLPIVETYRIGSVAPNNLPRRASSDIVIGNHDLPKDTLVIFNFWSVNHDPLMAVAKPPHLIPFSAGKRNCPGEGFANVELFLYIICMLQKYRVKVEPGTEISTEASFGLSRRPSILPTLIFKKIFNSD
uniref:Cytochrome P450 n=1 Tax=Tetranychus urticae TaxID=32264 RepID=T1JYL7_TETUR